MFNNGNISAANESQATKIDSGGQNKNVSQVNLGEDVEMSMEEEQNEFTSLIDKVL
ncbi:hypothetical protein MKX01_019276, partial [Papaver californicum]